MGLLVHAIMSDRMDFMSNFVWWVRYVEQPAVRWCENHHPSEWVDA